MQLKPYCRDPIGQFVYAAVMPQFTIQIRPTRGVILVAHLLHIIGQSRLILFRTTISIHQNAEPKSWKCEKPLFFAGMKSYLSNHKFSIANCIYFKDILNTTTPPCPTGCAFRLLD